DLLDQGADDPLSGCRRRTGAVPGGLDVGAEVEQALALGLGEHRFRAYGQRIPVVFESAHREQALIPALLQLGGDQTVVGVDCIILSTCPGGLVAGLLDCQLGLTRFGGHPESLARGAADAKNTSTVFAGVSPRA